jgi:response regulator RpfG family c-di-GMP phosphodiesterase
MPQEELDVLIVDDEPEILRLLIEAFSEHGWTTATAASVEEARDRLRHHGFKVILSDYNLPDGQGVDFLAELSGMGLRSVPLLMTGQMDVNVAIEAINRGKVCKFLTKPLDIWALCVTVRRSLEHYTTKQAHEQLTRDVITHNEHLRRLAESNEQSLRRAADRIRQGQETEERQKAHIETLYAEIQQAYLHVVTSLTAATEAKDRYTRGHSDRVFYYCSLIADVMGMAEETRRDLHLASVLHDLGKIGIPDSILNKPSPLTTEEFEVVAAHPAMADEILKPLPTMNTVRRIIREHHERYDGNGYPEGMRGEQISIESRVLAVADAYDAMRSDRAYRKALPQGEALLRIRQGAGTQFCPLCAGALIVGIENRGEPGSAVFRQESKSEEEYFRLRPVMDTVIVDTLSH